jgi:hypothetical protein
MKIKSIIFSLGMLLFLGNSLYAQTLDESRVRILPTINSNVLKVHYAIQTNEPLKVKFITKDGVVDCDKIKGGTYPTGVSKRYDVRNINDQDFWIEISSSLGSLTYKIVPSKDKQSFTPYLEKISHNPYLAVASK